MNEDRTYGIEFEIISQVTRTVLAAKIMSAFNAANIEHTVRIEGYGHSCDSSNTNVWLLKTDSSIRSTPTHSHGMELVSPVLKGEAGLNAVKVACRTIDDYATVNVSCGLHVHHGVIRSEMMNAGKAWIKAETTVLDCLPRSRRTNSYCSRWNSIASNSNFTSTLYDHVRRNRFTTLNFQSYMMRSTIEFRCAAGTTDARKAVNWILFTQAFVEAAQITTPTHTLNITELCDFINPPATTTNDTPFTSRSANIKRAYLLINAACFTPAQAVENMVANGAKESTAKTIVSDAKNSKYTPFGKIATINERGHLEFASTPATVETCTAYVQAGAWLTTRYNHFQNAA